MLVLLIGLAGVIENRWIQQNLIRSNVDVAAVFMEGIIAPQVRRLLAEPALRGALPFYFGDDLSDESGFAAVPWGISVHVGQPRRTAARYTVRTPAQVASTLNKIASLLD